jgi:hypothetical protein
MTEAGPVWDRKIIDAMQKAAVTFAWDDGEIRTVPAPEKALDTMQSAWNWIDVKLKELQEERGKPRSVCFFLAGREFRGLKFPDWQPGPL